MYDGLVGVLENANFALLSYLRHHSSIKPSLTSLNLDFMNPYVFIELQPIRNSIQMTFTSILAFFLYSEVKF